MKKWLACLLVVVMVMSSFCVAFAAEKKRDFVFIMDISFSMAGEKINSMKENVISAIDTIYAEAPGARIALIGYSNLVYDIADFTSASGAENLKREVEKLEAIVDTDIVEPIQLAQRKLMMSTAHKKVAVFFGDGVPRDDMNDIINAANGLKNVSEVYTVGLFQGVSATELPVAEEIMRVVATDETKCHFTESPEQLEDAMEDILDETVFDKNKIQITLDKSCEVSIVHNGEVLDKHNPRTSFGRIISDREEYGKKILRLKKDADYDLVIEALREDYVTYTIQYSDSTGTFTDTREVLYIPVQKGTRMYTNTADYTLTEIYVDLNNDGVQDNYYSVGPNNFTYASRPQMVYLSDYEVGRRLGSGKVRATATSYLVSSYGDYRAQSASDGNYKTCWVEGVAGNGYGEQITFTFEETYVTGFVIQSGMFKSAESFGRNTRVRELDIYVEGHPVYTVELKDVMRDQAVVFDPAIKASELTLELGSFYTSGTKGEDTCISEVWILHNPNYVP